MIAVPPYFLLIPYALFLAFFAFFSFANVLSLAKYGAKNGIGLVASFSFVVGAAVILFLTWRALGPVDWTGAIPLFSASRSGF